MFSICHETVDNFLMPTRRMRFEMVVRAGNNDIVIIIIQNMQLECLFTLYMTHWEQKGDEIYGELHIYFISIFLSPRVTSIYFHDIITHISDKFNILRIRPVLIDYSNAFWFQVYNKLHENGSMTEVQHWIPELEIDHRHHTCICFS